MKKREVCGVEHESRKQREVKRWFLCLMLCCVGWVGCSKDKNSVDQPDAVRPSKIEFKGRGAQTSGYSLCLFMEYEGEHQRLSSIRVERVAKAGAPQEDWRYLFHYEGDNTWITCEGEEKEFLFPIGVHFQRFAGSIFYGEGEGVKLGYDQKGHLVWYESVGDQTLGYDTVRRTLGYEQKGDWCWMVEQRVKTTTTGQKQYEQCEYVRNYDEDSFHPFLSVWWMHLLPWYRLGQGTPSWAYENTRSLYVREVPYVRYDTLYRGPKEVGSSQPGWERLLKLESTYDEEGYPTFIQLNYRDSSGRERNEEVTIAY